jgi:hypothetical protein
MVSSTVHLQIQYQINDNTVNKLPHSSLVLGEFVSLHVLKPYYTLYFIT